MGRKKEPPKPICRVRFDFVESMNNLCDRAMLTWQALDTFLKHADPKKTPAYDILRERADELRAALIGADDESESRG